LIPHLKKFEIKIEVELISLDIVRVCLSGSLDLDKSDIVKLEGYY
jgi:hypothetical protein